MNTIGEWHQWVYGERQTDYPVEHDDGRDAHGGHRRKGHECVRGHPGKGHACAEPAMEPHWKIAVKMAEQVTQDAINGLQRCD